MYICQKLGAAILSIMKLSHRKILNIYIISYCGYWYKYIYINNHNIKLKFCVIQTASWINIFHIKGKRFWKEKRNEKLILSILPKKKLDNKYRSLHQIRKFYPRRKNSSGRTDKSFYWQFSYREKMSADGKTNGFHVEASVWENWHTTWGFMRLFTDLPQFWLHQNNVDRGIVSLLTL